MKDVSMIWRRNPIPARFAQFLTAGGNGTGQLILNTGFSDLSGRAWLPV